MGDRRQIVFGNLYFYTHNDGYDLGIKLRDAIKVAKPRWDDASYCFRIILGELLHRYLDQETGAGLSFVYQDSDYKNKDFNVDIASNSITILNGPLLWSFDEFSNLTNEEILNI